MSQEEPQPLLPQLQVLVRCVLAKGAQRLLLIRRMLNMRPRRHTSACRLKFARACWATGLRSASARSPLCR